MPIQCLVSDIGSSGCGWRFTGPVSIQSYTHVVAYFDTAFFTALNTTHWSVL